MQKPGARALALSVAAAVAVPSLTACNDAPTPKPPEPMSSSATPSEPSGSPAPTMPAQASGTSEASAKAFVRFFFSTVNHALSTGDTAALKSAATATCRTCRQMVDRTEDIYGSGGHIMSPGWKVKNVTPIEDDTPRVIFLVGIDFPSEIVVQPGKDRIRRKPSRGAFTVFLRKSREGWLVNRLDLVQ